VTEVATAPAPPAREVTERMQRLRRLAIVPALNEEANVGRVIDEVRAVDPGMDVVVIDDGSTDATVAVAEARGAHVVRLPFNLGIGGAVQTGYRYAYEHDFDVAVQIDGDGQHDPAELPLLLGPLLDGDADMAVGSRFAGDGAFRSTATRRIGIRIFAGVVSLVAGQRLTDTTSGFRAVNRKGIALFAADYPHDYPEVEATVMCVKHKLRLREVPVTMRARGGGRSSITAPRSIYYMAKVLLAIFVALFRRYAVPTEEDRS
jgi:glycosyltransferase involved in cell wall biosynthesis